MHAGDTLVDLHAAVARCSRCADVLDPTKAPRRTEAGPSKSALFIVSQALARDTQRVSGMPYIDQHGVLSSTGERLEAFLNAVGFTLRPLTAVSIGDREVARAPTGLRQAYNSEIIQCFPGRVTGGHGDVFPTRAAHRCMEQRFMEREIALVDPSVILLLGNKAAKWFERLAGGTLRFSDTLSASLSSLTAHAMPESVPLGGKRRHVIRVIHPSGMTTRTFQRLVIENEPLATVVRRLVA